MGTLQDPSVPFLRNVTAALRRTRACRLKYLRHAPLGGRSFEASVSIYWLRTADAHPDTRWSDNAFTALDPDVRFPRFHMVEGDETIWSVRLIEGGLQSG
jgi:hypothetical protein